MTILLVLFALVLIAGFMVAEVLLDYLFAVIYALVATAIVNNIIHLIKYCRKHHKICTSDIGGIFGYALAGVGAWLITRIWL